MKRTHFNWDQSNMTDAATEIQYPIDAAV